MTTAAAPPSPSAVSASLARGILSEIVASTATKPGYIVVSIPGTSYQVHLRPQGEITTQVGKRIAGEIRCQCRRCDRVDSGGRYLEPVFGRPRRVQGTVIATNASANTLTVDAGGAAIPGVAWGLPIVVQLTDARNRAADFPVGAMVTFEVLDGATFREVE